jgi:hypothetical protein
MFLTIGELKVKCMRFWPLLLTVITLLLSQLPVRAAPLSIGDKATLQAAMQLHIDKNLVAGAYLHLDFDSGDVQELYPTASHPMILKFGQYFVLCSDFITKGGDQFNVDFYIAPQGDGHLVFRSEVDNRAPLMRLMKLGKIKRID